MFVDTFSLETQEQYKASHLWKPWMKDIRLRQMSSMDELLEFFECGEDKKELSWDLETESLDPDPSTVVGHCLAFDEDEGIYIPTRHKVDPEQNLDHEEVWNLILQNLENRAVVVFNWMFEGEALKRKGQYRRADFEHVKDVMIYNWLYDSSAMKFGLKEASKNLLGLEMLDIDQVPGASQDIRKKRNQRIDFSKTKPSDATLYAAADPVMTLRILKKIRRVVEDEQEYICKLEHRLLDGLFEIQSNPVTFDRAFLRRGVKDLERWIARVAGELYELAGYEFNIGSPVQVGEFLAKMGVPLEEKVTVNKKGVETKKRKTGAKEIEKLAGAHPVVDKVLLLRSLEKEKSTYAEKILSETSDENPSGIFKFKSVGAPTGRLASGGIEHGEKQYITMNAQAIPNADKYKPAKAWLIHNPPIAEMDAKLFKGSVQSLLPEDSDSEDGEEREDEGIFEGLDG